MILNNTVLLDECPNCGREVRTQQKGTGSCECGITFSKVATNQKSLDKNKPKELDWDLKENK